MKRRFLLVVVLVGGAVGFTALGCEFMFSYRSLTAPLGASGEVGIRVVKTHANCTLPNPYDYQLSARGVQVLGETSWTEVQPNVIEKWVLISLAEVGDGYLKVSKTCTKEGYEEGLLPITVTAPAPDGVWAQAWNGTYPFTLPEGYAVASVVGTAVVKDGVVVLEGRTFALPSVPAGMASS
ncbi:MAG TPA: hypothetical protein ENN53_02935, partial [Candidatus Acetothermia bacterium]|nr:hypothetical protein [Candidatus Acetothermia bacterium]